MSRGRIVLVAVVVALVVLAIGVLDRSAPDPDYEPPVRQVETGEGVAAVRLTLDSLDASRGTLKLRVTVSPGTLPLPPEGATLLMDLPGLGATNLPVERFAPDRTTDVVVESGDVNDYPFDTYRQTVSLVLVKGKGATGPGTAADRLPLAIGVVNAMAGFTLDVDASEVDEAVTADLTMTRTTPVIVWVLAMMGFYWLLAICAVAVVTATVLKLKEFETRHLAWLGTMIFAFAAFRNTAPGSPPIGVYLDFSAFFWAEFLVAVSLVGLVAFYLTGDRGLPKASAAVVTGSSGEVPPGTAATDDGSTDDGLTDDGLTDDGLTDDGLTDDGSASGSAGSGAGGVATGRRGADAHGGGIDPAS